MHVSTHSHPSEMSTTTASSIRKAAQVKMLMEIRKKYAPRMALAARFMQQAVAEAEAIDTEMVAEFEEAIGDTRHILLHQMTFEPNGCGCGHFDFLH